MNAIGIALIWCIVQITLLGVLAAGVYLLVRRLHPAAAAPVVFSSLAVVVILSILAFSPWPRWTIDRASPSPDAVALANSSPPAADGPGARGTEEVVEKAPSISRTSSRQPPPSPSVASPPAGKQHDVKAVETAKAEPVVKAPPSSAVLLWRTLMAELCRAQADDTWRWPAVVAIVLFAAMACGLGWLILGVAAVRRQRRRSKTVSDAELSELIDVLRAELGCLRAVEVRESGDLATAATIGWRRPVVLLPADWRTWTPEQRHAVLAHEIVHARSQDSVALLLGQLGLMLHCYHPLLHWLMNRLRLEQELAADAAAASVSGGPRQYLSTIAEIALLTQDRRLSWPTRTFLPTRTTFLRRIAMLRGSQVRFDPLTPIGRSTVVGIVLLFGVLAAGVRGPGLSSQALAGDTPTPPTGPTATKARSTPTAAQAAQPSAATAPLQGEAKLQYGCKKGEIYYYNVKIAASLPDEDVTHAGVMAYDVLSSNEDEFTLRCIANLRVAYKPKLDMAQGGRFPRIATPPGMFGPPRIPAPPGFLGRGEPIRPKETTFDRRGKIVRRGESASLSFLLGEQVDLVIEELPGEAKPAWATERELGVIERSQALGPPFFGPFHSAGSETNRGAKEHVDCAVVGQDQRSIRISKKYSLKTAPEQGVTHIDMSGQGELVFDRRRGVLCSEKMKYEIRVNEANVTVKIPVSVDCRLMSDAEAVAERKKEEAQLAKLKAEMAARAEAEKPKPLAPGEREWLLSALPMDDSKLVQGAARRLSRAIPGTNRTEFSKPLCAAYKNTNGDEWTQAEIMAALRVWAGPDAEKTVIEGSRNPSFMVRAQAIPALANFKTPKAAEAAAAEAAHNRAEVETAMKAMGSVAEPAAIALLENSDFWVRATAANILAEIGGKKALAALAREARVHPHHVHEVETAIVAIEKRLAESGDAAGASGKDHSSPGEDGEKAEESVAPAMRIWHAAAGSFTVRAAFVELKAGKVTLKKANGHVVKVPLEKLSKADQEYAKQQAKAREEKLEDPFQ